MWKKVSVSIIKTVFLDLNSEDFNKIIGKFFKAYLFGKQFYVLYHYTSLDWYWGVSFESFNFFLAHFEIKLCFGIPKPSGVIEFFGVNFEINFFWVS